MSVRKGANESIGASQRGHADSMASQDDLIPEPVLDQATAWAIRLHDAPDDEVARAELEEWLAQSDAHARAWARTKKAWLQMGQVPAAFAHEWPRRRSARARARTAMFGRGRAEHLHPAPRRRFGLRRVVFGLAACLAVALVLPSAQIWISADYMTAVAEIRQVALEDGSTVHLGADSAIEVKFADRWRQVTLLRGEAFFEVAPDRARPFSVHADDLDVTVTGTAFDVGFTERSFSVAVASGSVRVSRAGLGSSGAVDLTPGQGILIDRATGERTDTAPSPRTVAAWRTGRLIVENAPLPEVVAAIGRYRSGAIYVADAALREKRVTGGYDLRDPERALRLLVAPYGGIVTEYTPWLLVLSSG
jgi:transmembrane sensor